MDLELPKCPACGSTDVSIRVRHQEYRCEDCGHLWPLAASDSALVWPEGLAPETLPTYLAVPLAALLSESHPRLRLHWLVDCAEVALRWVVAVALAEVLEAGAGALPEAVVLRIREHVERPTLGRWLAILAALSNTRPARPLLAPAVFDLYGKAFAPRFRTEGEEGTPDNSLLVLRNHLAHGLGLRTDTAKVFLAAHEAGVLELLREVARATAGTELLAHSGGHAVRLAGPRPSTVVAPEARDGPWLIGSAGVLPLEPLAGYGPVRVVGAAGQLEERPGGPVAQIYLRADRKRLTYVPLGREEGLAQSFDVEAFRALFRLDVRPERRIAGEAFHWQDFLREARVWQEDLVGRAAELERLKAWFKGRDGRQDGVTPLGWIFGGPGLGKSLLMARVAADLGNAPPERQGLYYHRFRAGDARNSARAFLQGLLGALADWPPLPAPGTWENDGQRADEDALFEAARERLGAVATLSPPRPRAPPPRFIVLADGLDEVLPYAPILPARLRELALPGTVWLLASRPEPAIEQVLAGPGCERLFAQGLPGMSDADLRAMLEEGIEHLRHALVARDEDTETGVRNPFVERVVACADGLPLYVRLLLEDLGAGRLSVRDEDRLPAGLVAYYDELVNRIGLSDLKRDLPLLVAVLARAEEPLDSEALAVLLADTPEDAPRYGERVQNALRAGQVLLREAPTPEGTSGVTLYHQSFRDYVGGHPPVGDRPAVNPAPALAGTVADAEAKVCRLAHGWAALPPGNLRSHLFRWGVRYALRWQDEARVEAACARLTDFSYLQAFTRELPSAEVRRLAADCEAVLERLPQGPTREAFRHWEAFLREREHILRRGDGRWPTNRILLQLAVEHADDSPVTRAAEAWLEQGNCDWVWLRNPQRPAQVAPDACLRVLEGHARGVVGAAVLSDGRVLSWSWDKTLRLWDGESSAPLATLAGHTYEVKGAEVLPDGRILSWSDDGTLRFWDGQSGAPLATLAGHTDHVEGADLLPDGRILSWSRDGTLRFWDGQSGAPLATLGGHTGRVNGAEVFPDGRILSWSDDGTLCMWDGHSGAHLATLAGHTDEVEGAEVLPDGRFLSWSADHTLRLWDSESGAPLVTLARHTDRITGAQVLPDGRILSWSRDGSLRLWAGQSGEPLATFAGHTGWVWGGRVRPDGSILSWSDDKTLRIWDGESSAPLATLAGHTDRITGAQVLRDGRILSWSRDGTLRLWDGQSGAPLATLGGHTSTVRGTAVLHNGRVLSWSDDKTLRIWDGQSGVPLGSFNGHTSWVWGVRVLAGGRIVSSSSDKTPRLWDSQSGALLATLPEHTDPDVEVLPDGRILSWSDDGTLRLWDGQSGAPLATLAGHTDEVEGVDVLPDGRILSWSDDGTLRLWEGDNGALPVTIDRVVRVRVLPNGRIVWWSNDGTLRMWDGQSGAPLAPFPGHMHEIEGAEVLPDGRILAWSWDGTPRVWDNQCGGRLPAIAAHDDRVAGIRVLPGGRILWWSRDHTLRLWDGQSGTPLAQVLPDGRVFSWDGRTCRWLDDRTGHPWNDRSFKSFGAIPEEELPWVNPLVLWLRAQARSPARLSGRTTGWAFRNACGIASCTAGMLPVCWHGGSSVTLHDLRADGTLVVTLDSGHVFCLHLYRGTRRITVQEYEDDGRSPG